MQNIHPLTHSDHANRKLADRLADVREQISALKGVLLRNKVIDSFDVLVGQGVGYALCR